MAQSSIRYHPEVDIQEHEDDTSPPTKRVLVYGWDSDNLQKVRMKVNSDGVADSGKYKMIIDESTTSGVTYIGEAPRGTATSATGWSVMKIDETGSVAIFTWSSGIWDNRATSLVYT